MDKIQDNSIDRSRLKQILLAKRLRGELPSKNQNKSEPSQNSTASIKLIPNLEERYQPFALTEVQQAYWIGRSETFELGNVPAHIYLETEIADLDLDRFTQAWQLLIERHEMLRAVILTDGQQRILEQVPAYQIKTTDLQGQSQEAIEQHLLEWRDKLSHQMLACDRYPLFEIRASQLDKRLTRLHFSFDFLIGDAQSFQVLVEELARLYQNPQAILTPLEVSFRDYVLALDLVKEAEIYQKSLSYWQQRLTTLPKAPELPLNKHLATIKQPRFVHRSDRLEPELWQKLKAKATQAGITPSVVLLTAYSEILSYWSKSSHFCLNLTLFNRFPLHSQIERVVGDFTSISLLEVDNRQNKIFLERAKNIQEQLWADLDHRHVSGIAVLRELAQIQGRASTATMPVVFTSTVDLNAQDDTLTTKLGEIKHLITQTPQVWLDNQVQQQNGALVFHWDAIADLFPDGLLNDMFAAYSRLIQRLATEEAIWTRSNLDLLPPQQKKRLKFTNTVNTNIPDGLLHEGFIAKALIQGDRPGVITPELSLSYEELYRRSNQLGNRLRMTVAPNQLVGIVMEKGWEQVVAVLGVLASGAAYVPIDPALPQQRLEYILEHTQVKTILTQAKLAPTLQLSEGISCICLDTDELDRESDRPLAPVQKSTDLAYVIYTSGSTGMPKGVAIDHQGAVNTITDINRRFQVEPSDRLFALSSLSFDLSVYDIFGILAAGATMVIPEASGVKDPALWLELIARHQVTIWNSVPALMQMLIDYSSDDPALNLSSSLRLILLSGDWLPLGLASKLKSGSEDIQVISLGGATEASIWSIFYPIEQIDSTWKSIPYGQPLTNQNFYVFDEQLQPRPTWVSGQLYIGGIGLARGYWQDPEKTAASFIIHPETGERLYRTGDLGRYLPDSNIEFLGREDFQVKVQGYRIELGEIEAALQSHPRVERAIVSAIGEAQKSKQLVAYVVPKEAEGKPRETENQKQIWRSLEQIEPNQSQPTPELENIASISQSIDRLSTAYICNAFRELGIYTRPGESHTAKSLAGNLKILTRYQNLLGQWLRILADDDLIQAQEDGAFTNLEPLPEHSVEELWQEVADINRENKSILNLLKYIKSSGDNLTAMLTGEINPLELLFPDGSWQVAENLYQNNPVSRYINSLAQKALEILLQSRNTDKPLRVLELGAGTGATTAYLLPVLPSNSTQYVYTDVSNFFLNLAQNKFSDYSFVEYQLLDINQSFISQDYELHSFDLVIAANVLHDAHDLQETLKSITSVLTVEGYLLLLEATRYLRVGAISLGFVESYGQNELPTDSRFMSLEQWQTALESTGFSNFLSFPETDSVTKLFGQAVMLSQAPSSHKTLDQNLLLSFLREKLPEYMIPSTIFTLDAIPLTTNGKVDRNSLPQPQQNIIESEKNYTAPRTKTEQILAEILADTLNIERVGIYDNFFSIGGDSLLGIQIIARAKKAGFNLKPRQIFQYPTIAELGSFNTQIDDPVLNCLVKIKPEGNKPPLFCIHSSSGSADSYVALAKYIGSEQPLYGLQSPDTNVSSQPLCVEDMAQHYLKAIQTIQPDGVYHLCGWSMGGIVAYEIARQLKSSGVEVKLALLDIDAQNCYEQLMALSVRAKQLGLLPEQLEDSQRNLTQANIQAMLNYKLQKYPGKITLFKASEQPQSLISDEDFGWSAYAQELEIQTIPGDHFSILQEPQVRSLSEKFLILSR